MSRAPYTGPRLPQTILDKVGGSHTSHKPDTYKAARKNGRSRGGSRHELPTRSREGRTASEYHIRHSLRNGIRSLSSARRSSTTKAVEPTHPRRVVAAAEEEDSDSGHDEPHAEQPASAAAKRRLEADDAEIAALERKLGIKRKRSKASDHESLDWIADGEDAGSDDDQLPPRKRFLEEDDKWLRSKRRMTTPSHGQSNTGRGISGTPHNKMEVDTRSPLQRDSISDSDMEDLENPFSADELSDDDCGFQENDSLKHARQSSRVRENPYTAPIAAEQVSEDKYIPPSQRRKQLGVTEDLSQLRRQLQGQLNRLSDANFLSILQSVEDIYVRNARQHVSSTVVGLLADLVNTPAILSENFLILYSGFATAIFKTVGADFAASLLDSFTTSITTLLTSGAQGKNVLNLVGFLANSYILQMIGPSIIFGYIRLFLADFTEDSTELLLRIVRTAGSQLRSDDPSSLKDVVVLLTRAVSQRVDADLSVRTKFMIETIMDLKNNRVKTNAASSALTSEHFLRMRKTLSTLNSKVLRASEPLQISLEDIRESDKKGKWWLVGASYHDPAKLAVQQSPTGAHPAIQAGADDDYESETTGRISLQKLARSEGMNTDVRRSIFLSLMSATDYEDAHNQIAKLSLKNKQAAEVPKVLLHCAGAEKSYNPYYTIVAKRLCADKRLRKAFQSILWDVLRKISIASHAIHEEETEDDRMDSSQLVILGRLFGNLIADGCLTVSSLKTVEFSYPSPKLQSFVEVLFTTVMLRCGKLEDPENAIETVFVQARSAPNMIVGMRFFLEQTLSLAALASGSKERKAVQNGCQIAIKTLETIKVPQSISTKEPSDTGYSSDSV